MKKTFPYIVLLASLSLASCAAYYSVFGLSKLFSAQAIAVIIMCSILEASKLITATYLHRYAKKISLLLKTYLTSNINSQISLLESRKNNFSSQLEVYNEEKSSINDAITNLRQGLSNNKIQWKDKESGQIITSTSSSTRRALTKQLDQAIERQTVVNTKIDELNVSIIDLETSIMETKLGDETVKELGPLKYLSELLNIPMNSIVNWFVLAFIFVFDPLAVLLLISANKAFELKQDETDYLLKSKANKKHLEESIEQAEQIIKDIEDNKDNENPNTPSPPTVIIN